MNLIIIQSLICTILLSHALQLLPIGELWWSAILSSLECIYLIWWLDNQQVPFGKRVIIYNNGHCVIAISMTEQKMRGKFIVAQFCHLGTAQLDSPLLNSFLFTLFSNVILLTNPNFPTLEAPQASWCNNQFSMSGLTKSHQKLKTNKKFKEKWKQIDNMLHCPGPQVADLNLIKNNQFYCKGLHLIS